VDTEDGLLVPVIRDVNRKGINELAKETAELAELARARKLKPDQMQGASFTISSLGGIGGTAFTPIINGRRSPSSACRERACSHSGTSRRTASSHA